MEKNASQKEAHKNHIKILGNCFPVVFLEKKSYEF